MTVKASQKTVPPLARNAPFPAPPLPAPTVSSEPFLFLFFLLSVGHRQSWFDI